MTSILLKSRWLFLQRKPLWGWCYYSSTGGEFPPGSSWLDKIHYNSYLERFTPPKGYRTRMRERFEEKSLENLERVGKSAVLPPVSVQYLLKREAEEIKEESSQEEKVEFPFKFDNRTEFVDEEGGAKVESVGERLRKQEVNLEEVLSQQEEEEEGVEVDVGTPNPKVPPSNIPCGGCGAFLHCQDPTVPGYISSERFLQARPKDLMIDICHRCSVLDAHQSTLNVNVSSEDYPQIVAKIRSQFAIVLLLVDLTDFPCSIWPGILEIIGNRRPVVLIGNKVDLLPQDSPDYLKRIEEGLIKCVVDVGMLNANIIHTALISAKTGYGVEPLISKLFNLVRGKGDVFIMGCTNVGKSSLFNLLLESDLCKPQVSDLVQKATISKWPGTTLNLLKFPMTDPNGWQKLLRDKRLKADKQFHEETEKERKLELKITGDPSLAVLQAPVGRTFINEQKQNELDRSISVNDIFHVNPQGKTPPAMQQRGVWNPDDPRLEGHWVYDTPGAVNSNQILDLLTLPELNDSLPNTLIHPRTYFIKPGMSFFIGGLARVDFTQGPYPIRYTLFGNSSLPVTICETHDAPDVYQNALGTKVFQVPSGGESRLEEFPPLVSKHVTLDGISHTYSCGDIVLSSIGWFSVTAGKGQRVFLDVFTPSGKGIFVREQALLPYAVNFKGKRIRGTYSYLPHKIYTHPINYKKDKSRVKMKFRDKFANQI